jgi:hypothetical protein
MTIPTVTEITRREPVAHDTFIDDLRSSQPPASAAMNAIASPAASGSSGSRLI